MTQCVFSAHWMMSAILLYSLLFYELIANWGAVLLWGIVLRNFLHHISQNNYSRYNFTIPFNYCTCIYTVQQQFVCDTFARNQLSDKLTDSKGNFPLLRFTWLKMLYKSAELRFWNFSFITQSSLEKEASIIVWYWKNEQFLFIISHLIQLRSCLIKWKHFLIMSD